MTPKQLKYFVHVAEFGSFTKAATALSVPQPTLSRLIRELEVQLRHNLLLRDGRGVTLTEEGVVLFEHAKGILSQIERAHQDIINIKGSPVGKVTVGATTTTGLRFIVQLVSTFRSRFPKASLEIVGGASRDIYDWLLNGRIDVGVLYDPRPSPLLDITGVNEEDVYLVSAASKLKLRKTDKVPFSKLSQYSLILPGQPHTLRTAIEIAAAKTGIKLNVSLQVDNIQLIMALVNAGQGSTLCPQHSFQEKKSLNNLQGNLVVAPRLTRTTAIALPSQRRITHLTQETAKLIQQFLVSSSSKGASEVSA